MLKPIGIKICSDLCKGRVIARRLCKKITIPLRIGSAEAVPTADFP